MIRRLFLLVSVLSLLLFAATIVLWVRSLKAFDQVTVFTSGPAYEINGFSGRCEVFKRQFYRRKIGVDPRIDPLEVSAPFRLLDAALGRWLEPGERIQVSRSRWPLRETSGWRPYESGFPMPGAARWLIADSRDDYVRVVWLKIPYWLPLVLFALPPLAWAMRFFRRKGMDGGCVVCGYDLRATPDRCPECGTPVTQAQAVAR